MPRRMLSVLATAALAACASAPSTPTPNNLDRITASEIDAAGVSNVYDLVEKLRPQWLRKRGEGSFFQQSDVVVYVNNTPVGGPDELRSISSANVESLQFLDPRQATFRFGPGHVHGAILLKMKGT